jgi:phosphatidylserine/phosphatidylglycerophosphate/cardiolipin synthase-like enzyme
MDRWGLRWNLEANLESDDAALCADIEACFSEAFAQAKEITLEAWLKRPASARLREWLLSYVDLMMERYSLRREARRIHARERISEP